MKTKEYITGIRNLIAQNNIDEAIKQLQLHLKDSPRQDEIILHSSSFHDIQRQIRLGLVNHNEANITQNQIRASLLDLLCYIEENTAVTADRPNSLIMKEEIECAVPLVESKGVTVDTTITAGNDLKIGDKTFTQAAEKIYNIDKIDNANFS